MQRKNSFIMKKQIETFKYQLMLIFFLLFNTTIALAQDGGGSGSAGDGGTSVTVSKTSTSSSTTSMQDWYTQPWVWIVGGLVFILLLIALVRGGGGSRTDVHRTTIRRDVSTD